MMLMSICFLSVTVMVFAGSRLCQFEPRCRCVKIRKTNYYKADCSHRNLHYIPRFPNIIKSIDLSFNNINEIPDNTFTSNIDLEELLISNNKLKYLGKGSFQGLETNVLTLSLNDNNITRMFLNLTKLQYLDLKHNDLDLSKSDFSLLPSLKYLRLDFTGNQSLPVKLPGLTKLDISGISGECNVKTLTSGTFKFFPALEFIDISACGINYIYKGTFKDMRNLSYLDVSFNRCLRFSGLENITYDLPTTNIKILKANNLHNPMSLNTEVKVSHIEHLQYTNLTEIHVDGNRIQLVESGALRTLPKSIRIVSASDNNFSYGPYLIESVFVEIEIANFSCLFSGHNTHIHERCDYQDNLYGEQKSSNVLKEDIPLINSYQRIFPIPRTLKRISYTNCYLRYTIPANTVSDNNLEYIDVSYNIFYSWIGPLRNLPKLKVIDMSNNLCSNVSYEFFQGISTLQTLYIQNNLLGFVLPGDVNGQIMQYFSKLRYINLSNNRIPSLPSKFFKSLTSLRKIYISGNMLDDITFQISHMKQLSYVDISNNRISFLYAASRRQIDTIVGGHHRLTVDMSGNSLLCTCDTVDFIEWMTTTNAQFHKLSSYNCKDSNGKIQTLSNPKRMLENLQKQCSSYSSLIIGSSSGLICFLFILCSGLVYRYRWKLRYMYYMTKNKYHRERTDVESDSLTYEFDTFISYEDTDGGFVHDKCIKKLEKEAGFKLCIHKRDFLAGVDIAENITSAIHNSRKTVVILSRRYLDSYWCMFEYNMARLESIYSRNKENILYLVFLEHIPSENLPLIILELVQTQCYIEFPNDEYGDTIFWDKLREALK